MNFVQKKSLAIFVMATVSTSSVNAAESVQLTIKGSIIPSACGITLNAPEIDYGNIDASKLQSGVYNVLPDKETVLSITCQSAAPVAFTVTSGAKNTAATDSATYNAQGNGAAPIALAGFASPTVAGLGMSKNNKPVGGYLLMLSEIETDGTTASLLVAPDVNSPSWSTPLSNSLFNASAQAFTFSKETDKANSYTTYKAKVNVHAYLNKLDELDMSSAVQLKGTTTFDIIYL